MHTLHILLHLAILTATVLAIARFFPGVEVRGIKSAIVVAVVFSVLNYLTAWLLIGLLKVLLFLPAVLTLGLVYVFIPFLVNTLLLWLTDKLIGSFEIKRVRTLFLSAGVITAVTWAWQALQRRYLL